jgi:hypothetical protein
MGILKLDSRRNKPLTSVRFVTHKGSSMKVNTTAKRGVVGFRMNSTTFIGDRLWTPKHLKTTKFIAANPVVDVKKGDEPPF